MTDRKTSERGVAAIRQREGFRTLAYQDTRGIWTIGVGHTGPEVHSGVVWNLDQVDGTLSRDLARFEAAVSGACRADLTQNQFDACVSLAFNIGCHGFAGSTVVHMLNLHRYRAAGDAFLMWERPPELKARREGERAQFLTPDPA